VKNQYEQKSPLVTCRLMKSIAAVLQKSTVDLPENGF
jgi:hypothetical protein